MMLRLHIQHCLQSPRARGLRAAPPEVWGCTPPSHLAHIHFPLARLVNLEQGFLLLFTPCWGLVLWAVRCCSEGEQGEGEEPHTAAELVGGPQPLLFAATVNMGSRWPLAAWVVFLPTPVLGWAKLTFGSVHDSPRSKGIICGCWSVLRYLDFLSGRQKAPWEREARFPVTM